MTVNIFNLIIGLFSLVTSITSFYILYELYEKAGEGGWTLFIPIYGFVVYIRISNTPVWLNMLFIFCLVGLFFGSISDTNVLFGIILNLLVFIIGLIIFVEFVKKYDGSLAFWLCYIFIPIIAVFLVKKVKYTGGVMGNDIIAQAPLSRYPSYSRPSVLTVQEPVVDSSESTNNLNSR